MLSLFWEDRQFFFVGATDTLYHLCVLMCVCVHINVLDKKVLNGVTVLWQS